jgi:hypothetical protein
LRWGGRRSCHAQRRMLRPLNLFHAERRCFDERGTVRTETATIASRGSMNGAFELRMLFRVLLQAAAKR